MYKHILTSALVAFISIAFVSSAQATDSWQLMKQRTADAHLETQGTSTRSSWGRFFKGNTGVKTEEHVYANEDRAGFYANPRGWVNSQVVDHKEAALAAALRLEAFGEADKGRGPGVAGAASVDELAVIVGRGDYVRLEQQLSGDLVIHGEDSGRHETVGSRARGSISQYGEAVSTGRDATASIESTLSISTEELKVGF